MVLLSHGHPGSWSPSGLLLQPYFHWVSLNQKQTTLWMKASVQSQAVTLSLGHAACPSTPAAILGGLPCWRELPLPFRNIYPGPPQGWRAMLGR